MEQQMESGASKQIDDLADKTKQTVKKAKDATQKVVKKAAKKGGKTLAKLLTNPLFWKILLIVGCVLLAILLVVVLVAVIINVLFGDTFDPLKCTLAPLSGIERDKFYGARTIYEDNIITNSEIKENYTLMTTSLLKDIKANGTNLNIDFSNPNSEVTITIIVTNFAKELALNIDDTATITSLDDSLAIIDHYGLKTEEAVIVFNSIANTIKNANLSTEDKVIIVEKLNIAFADEKYSNEKLILPKIVVKDLVFEEGKKQLGEITREKYLGYVFMPKEDVTFNTISFRFVINQGYNADIELIRNDNGNEQILLEKQTIDNSWYNEGDFEIYEYDGTQEVSTYTAINSANTSELKNGVSLYKLIVNNQYSTYFKAITGEYTGEELLKNINSNNYIYLRCSSDTTFNLAEYITKY
ncbi:MAG: hypothetical protein SOV27_03185 [Eubacteriales bacterium]|nr:hypothetical protein [Eubacteriales bacterium]